jgi:hypothetical protein
MIASKMRSMLVVWKKTPKGRVRCRALFNRVLKCKGDSGSAAKMRTIGYFSNIAHISIVDIELERRLTAFEEKIGSTTPRQSAENCLRIGCFNNGT